jgi:hypothetical protein
MSRSPSQIWGRRRAGSCNGAGGSRILEDVSRRRKQRPQIAHHAPTMTSATDEFSDQELEFFRRGDELHPPAGDTSDAPDSDA